MLSNVQLRVLPKPLALALLVTACGDHQDVSSYLLVRDSAGITVITNTLAPLDSIIYDEPALTIGGPTAADPYVFEDLADLAVLADGAFVVADLGGRVARFAADGSWQLDFGRVGSGPGEFRRPRSLQLRDDTVVVWDSQLRRISLFTSSGRLVNDHALQKEDRTLPMHWLGASWFDEQERGQAGEPAPAQAVLVRVAASGVTDTVLGPYAVPESRVVSAAGGRIAIQMPPVFSIRPQWRICGEWLIWTDPAQGNLEMFDLAGQPHRRIELNRERRRVTDEDREAYVIAMGTRWDLDPGTMADMRQSDHYLQWAPLTGALVCGSNGSVWVNHFEPGVPTPLDAVGSSWDVVDGTGRGVQHVQFPRGFVLKAVGSAYAYGVARRELDVHVVEIYNLDAIS